MEIEYEKKTVLITGASSGIGLAIAMTLADSGYEVYGIGRSFDDTKVYPSCFHCVTCDITDTEALEKCVKEIRRQCRIDVLINNAGCAYYGLHEELNASKIKKIVRTDLEAPIILTQMLLRDLKVNGGSIINISSVTAISHANPHGAAYGAAKAGLYSFTGSIFEEARKHGVRVTAILPDMTDTCLYRNADFEADDEKGCSLSSKDIADAVLFVLSRPEGVVIEELVIRPQLHRIKRKRKNDLH